jgi:hypothetical protein
MSRVTQVMHLGKQIVHIDFSGCEPGSFAPVIAEAEKLILKQPLHSVRALTVVDDVRFDMGTVKEMQQFVSATTPHLKGNAIVGVEGMKKIVWGGIKPFYKVPADLFSDVAAAKDWLAKLV